MKTQFNLVTQWIADDGTQNTGSDERLISTHSTFADAQKALEKVQIRHPHNHAEIVEVDAPHTAHTPGPWTASFATVRKASAPLAECYNDHPLLPGEANAARIVACVNACEGIADPGAVPDLLAALKSALDIMEGREAGSERIDAIAQARAAIARATGEKGGK
jgi:hypothetical protein